jgi:hypothetical protein
VIDALGRPIVLTKGLVEGSPGAVATTRDPRVMAQWVLASDRSIRSQRGFCLTATGSKAGAAIAASQCTGVPTPAQAWIPIGTTLRNLASGLCLASASTASSAPLALAPCDGRNTESWVTPAVPAI